MQWQSKPVPNTELVQELAKSLSIPLPIAILLAQRGIENFDQAKTFFRPDWEQLHDPLLMKDMERAVERIHLAKTKQEKVMVFGDYDVDGTTSVALMTSFLRAQLSNVLPYIPDRYNEGYGVSIQGIDHAYSKGITLIIALDCGVKAIEKVAYAKEKGIDFIICDHHLPGATLPQAYALLDPKRSDCDYPFKELCGCGVGFKLIQALTDFWELPKEDLFPYLDLAATAIAADIVPIVGENRVLCFFGLIQLTHSPREGIKALLQTLKKPPSITDLVFRVAPRINAAGRMDHALKAAELLLTQTAQEATEKAASIEQFNTERRATDEQITKEALEQIEARGEHDFPASVVYSDHWHKGVVGIVASRVIETYYRPTVVLTRSGKQFVGSVRSVSGFDVYLALEACSSYMVQFGGHKYAAGLTLSEDQLEGFKKCFEEEVEKRITEEQKTPRLVYDLEIPTDEITPKLYRIIEQMAPFGPQNMRPVFVSRGCTDNGGTALIGKEHSHLRVGIQTSQGSLNGIAFNQAEYYPQIKKGIPFSIAYSLDENEWNGVKSLQLKIRAIEIEQ